MTYKSKPKINNTEWRAARKRAIASMDAICAICHKPIDLQQPNKLDDGKLNALAVEVDHIIPKSRGGQLYAIDNLQLSHRECNRQKGAKMPSDYEAGKHVNPVPLSNNW